MIEFVRDAVENSNSLFQPLDDSVPMLNHWQMVNGSGMVTLGTVKYWLLDAVNEALYAFAQGPAACDVGADEDAVRGPSRPDTSARKLPELKG